jgi:mitochondrial protein import protein ZIM17
MDKKKMLKTNSKECLLFSSLILKNFYSIPKNLKNVIELNESEQENLNLKKNENKKLDLKNEENTENKIDFIFKSNAINAKDLNIILKTINKKKAGNIIVDNQFNKNKTTKPQQQDKMGIIFTCKKCNERSYKEFTKNSYYHGIVIVVCPKCENLHLIADNLGWFKDEFGFSKNIEQIISNKGEKVKVIKKE